MIQLNLGCGFNKKEGFVNADKSEGCAPDVKIDLAREKWPWADSSVSEVVFSFSLEEMGETKSDLFFIVRELYRVCAKDAKIFVMAVHPRHDRFVGNPLCVHRLSPEFFSLLSIGQNLMQIANGLHSTCLGLELGVNFEIVSVKLLLSMAFQDELKKGGEIEQRLRQRIAHEGNICEAFDLELVAKKDSKI